MKIKEDIKLDFSDVLILPKRSTLNSRGQVSLERTWTMKHSQKKWTGVPVVASNMDTVGSMKMAKELAKHKMICCLHKFYSKQELIDFYESLTPQETPYVFYSMGIAKRDQDKFEEVHAKVGEKLENVCLDVANGYQESFVQFLTQFRKKYPSMTIMAGNVVTGEMTEHLILAGADIVKVGIGSGSACLTRKVAGVGCPQLSAILECADSAHGLGGLICSDGGCTCPGDIAKAFGAGSDFVMLGGMLAGYDECDGVIIEKDGQRFLKFHGMSSKEAMETYYGGLEKHRASEGKEVLVACKGPVENQLLEIMGGIRSACSYVGAKQLKYLSRCTTFIRVNRQLNEVFGKS